MSLLQQPLGLHDQPGVRHKSPGATLTTLPRKHGATLIFPVRHSGEEDKPPITCCSSLGEHAPVPAHSSLLPSQAVLAR